MKIRTRAVIFVGALWLAALVCINVARAQDIYVRSTFKTVPTRQLIRERPAYQIAANKLRRWWGGEPTTVLVGRKPANSSAWQITVNGPTEIGSSYLGFHFIGPGGIPYAIIKWDAQYATSVTITHELEEMIVDPYITRTATEGSRDWLIEVSDPVEATSFMVQGVPISNFVGPNWYKPHSVRPYDYMHIVTKPEQVLYGGYAPYWDGTDWNAVINASCGVHCFGFGGRD